MLRLAQVSDERAVARLHADSWRTAYRGILRDDFLVRRRRCESP